MQFSDHNSFLDDLNKEQKIAATWSGNHALVLAGAGCGKTKTIIARAAYLISQGTSPERIQILTFTKKAATEIVERVKIALGEKAHGLKASTFHTWCVSLMRRNPKLFSAKTYTIIDRDDQLMLFKSIRALNKNAKDALMPNPATLIDIYSYARNTLKSLEQSLILQKPESIILYDSILNIMKNYEKKKSERSYIDYDDILDIVATIISINDNAKDWLSNKYDYILIDEMQDTNPLQWKLISPLQDRIKLFCVGDDAQSIYGFRGADFRNIHEFQNKVNDSVILKLTKNYRSTQEILDISNWLLEQSPLKYNKKLESNRGKGIIPQLYSFTSNYEEARWIVEDILQQYQKGTNFNNNMILVRTGYSGKFIETCLIEKKIPYIFIGGTKLFDGKHVKDLLSSLRVAFNPNDEIAWMRYLTLFPGMGDVSAANAWEIIYTHPTEYMTILSQNKKISDSLQLVIEIKKQSNNVKKCIQMASVYLEKILEDHYKNHNWEKRKKDFILLEKLAENHDSIGEFIEEYLLNPVYGTTATLSKVVDSVTLITIHSAKGTECDRCYVVDVSPGNFPSSRNLNNEEQIEEERRVLYVALTRAKNELIVTRNSDAGGYSSWSRDSQDSKETYFLNNINNKLITSIVLQEDSSKPIVGLLY